MSFNIQKPLSLFSNSDLLNYLLSNNLQKFSSIVQKSIHLRLGKVHFIEWNNYLEAV